MKVTFITGLLLLLPLLGNSQGEFNKWYFPEQAGLDFNTNPPSPLVNSGMNFGGNATASISDSLGNLLFYSEGELVYNRNHQMMPNGDLMLFGIWGVNYSQPVFAVRQIGIDPLYYLFCYNDTNYTQSGLPIPGLFYSVIDMSLNGGLGDVVSGMKNVPVLQGQELSDKMHGTRHYNNKDVWLVTRNRIAHQYVSYLINSSGISSTPVFSPSLIRDTSYAQRNGSMKISQDGKKLAAGYYNRVKNFAPNAAAEFCKFNYKTGVVTPLFCFRPIVGIDTLRPYDVEFSRDSRFLYIIAAKIIGLSTQYALFQYDATLSDSLSFMQSEVFLGYTTGSGVHGLQLAPDGKIYGTQPWIDSLSAINYPNVQGIACGFQKNALGLNGQISLQGLPQFLQRYKACIHSSGQCQGQPVTFSGDIWPPADTIHWNFGDPASGGSNVSYLASPAHLYSSPGTYTVELYVRHNDNRTDTTWRTITILPSPQPALGPDQTILQGNTATFDAGSCAGCTYQWANLTLGQPNIGTGQTYTTGVAGVYMVSVTNATGCIGRDTIQLTVIPNNPVTQGGYEFWFAAPAVTDHTISPSTLNWTNLNKPIRLYLMTAEGPASVMINQPANPSFVPILKTVNNDSAREVDLTPFIESVETKPANSILNTGLHITSDKKINVIYEIQSPHNAATYTLAGKDALGYEFIIPAQSHLPNFPYCDPPARNVFDIVATEDSTVVHIIPKQPVIGHPPADTFAIILNRGQTWSGRAASGDSSKHIGGSFVFSDKPVAVTITDDALFVPGTDESTFDIAGDQLMPRDLCGTEFIPVAFLDAFKPKLWIYAFEDQTYVTMVDTSYTLNDTLNRGEWTEFILDIDPNLPISTGYAGYLHSNKPVLVYELTGRGVRISASGNASDQYAASVLPPISCTGSKRVCLSRTPPFGAAFSVNNLYWTIVTKNGNQGNIQNNRGLTTANGGFRTVPGTNGEYVFGISAIGGTGALAYMNIIFTSSGDRFQFSSGSSTDNFFTNNYSYSKYSYYSEYSKLSLGPDRSMCPGDSVFLDAGYGRDYYLWSTGETTQTIWVKTAGTYWVSSTEPDCNLSDTIVISYYPSTPVNLGPDRFICQGDSTMLNAGTGRPWYLWSTGATTQSIWVKNPGHYWVSVPDVHCNVSDTVLVTATMVPVVTNIPPLSKTICTGESTNIPLFGSEPGIMFHWTATLTSGNVTGFTADSGLVINQILINNGPTAGVVIYHITPKIGDCAGDPVDYAVTVNGGDPVDVSISASGNNVCAGTTVTLTASPVNPGTTPIYQWKVNGVNTGSNAPTFAYVPANGDILKCILTSSNIVCTSNNPDTSNSITMVVNPIQPVSISVSPSANPVCSGTTVNFTALPVNGGSNPSWLWKVNGLVVGSNAPAYSYVPVNGDAVTCTLTSNVQCPSGNPATSGTVTMIVNSNLPVGVSIVASSNPFCAGSSVTFTASPVNGGTTPGYQWKVNGINYGINSPVLIYSPVNGDVVTCSLLSSETCTSGNPAQSNPVTMVVNATLPAGITILASVNPFCPGSAVTFTATPVNGGSTPVYQWKVNGTNAGTNASTFTYNPQNNDSVRCILTSNLNCVTGNPVSSAKIIISGSLAPNVTFTTCFDTVTTISAKPFKLKGGTPLGGTFSGPGVNPVTGVFTPSAAGTGLKTIFYTYTNVLSCSANMSKTILLQPNPTFTCGNNLIDIRDNKIYSTVQIGVQCWMQTNLEFGSTIVDLIPQTDNCKSERYLSNVNSQSSFYQWDELMRYDPVSASQGICPPGWHVPTSSEWDQLLSFYNGPGLAGGTLKDDLLPNGFQSHQTGFLYLNNTWAFTTGLAAGTMYWTSTSSGTDRAVARGLNEYNMSVSRYEAARGNGFALRCIRD